jgi:hypothetical protein
MITVDKHSRLFAPSVSDQAEKSFLQHLCLKKLLALSHDASANQLEGLKQQAFAA